MPGPHPGQLDDICRKNVTVSFTGGPAGPGPSSNCLSLVWSISTDCPTYSPFPGPISYGPVPETTPIPRTASVVSTAVPAITVDLGVGKPTKGIATGASPAGEPYPALPGPLPANPSYGRNIHTRYVVTGTAPVTYGGASGSTSWGVVCLPLDTEIEMEDGTKRHMGDVKVGDRVKTYDPDKNEISSHEVTHLLKRHVASELMHIKIDNSIEFRATPEHECWIRRDDVGMWVMAELIEVGDYMLTEGIEYKKVVSVERVEYEEGIEVGNISVADAHVYFANKVLLHNFSGL